MTTYHISKYALSTGIFSGEGRKSSIGSEYVFVGNYYASFKIGRDAHLTREEAIAAAERARSRKIASLRKQIAKLEAMVFK